VSVIRTCSPVSLPNEVGRAMSACILAVVPPG
jgi:hypothetical protein